MGRKFSGQDLVVATHNKGKVAEFATLLKPFVKNFVTVAELGLPEPEETGTTFKENSTLKSKAAAEASGKVALADDSGIEVYALNGAPGVYTADWAGTPRDFTKVMERINTELAKSSNRKAAFVCAISLTWPDGYTEVVEGRCEGHVIWPPRGDKGFGVDPMFIPDGYTQTFAEMSADKKHKISHRAKALEMMVKKCFQP